MLCVGCVTAVNAQTFTQRLQQSNSGEGKVTVTQDQEIDALVNGTANTPTTSSTNSQKPPQNNQKEKTNTTASNQDKQSAVQSDTPQYVTTTDSIDIPQKVIKGNKVNGYRVQVFAGGNSRNDRIKAERTGDEIKSLFPGTPVYVHFYSPRWICRMGNYRSYEEAHEVLNRVKNLGYQSAIIVKGKITVPY